MVFEIFFQAFGTACRSPQAIVFTQAQINQIVSGHNTWRNNVAGGTIRGFNNAILPTATRMARMVWHSELAHFADLNTRRCVFSHDSCRSSNQFNHAGQNMFTFSTSGTTIDVTQTINSAINSWSSQHQWTRVSDINNLTGTTGGNGNTIGHFTAMINARMTHVGCGMTIFTNSNNWRQAIFTCNYAFNNFINRPVYVSGAITSQCTTGRDTQFTNLCTINENINVNNP